MDKMSDGDMGGVPSEWFFFGEHVCVLPHCAPANGCVLEPSELGQLLRCEACETQLGWVEAPSEEVGVEQLLLLEDHEDLLLVLRREVGLSQSLLEHHVLLDHL